MTEEWPNLGCDLYLYGTFILCTVILTKFYSSFVPQSRLFNDGYHAEPTLDQTPRCSEHSCRVLVAVGKMVDINAGVRQAITEMWQMIRVTV